MELRPAHGDQQQHQRRQYGRRREQRLTVFEASFAMLSRRRGTRSVRVAMGMKRKGPYRAERSGMAVLDEQVHQRRADQRPPQQECSEKRKLAAVVGVQRRR